MVLASEHIIFIATGQDAEVLLRLSGSEQIAIGITKTRPRTR